VLNPRLLAQKTENEYHELNPLDEEFTISEESPRRTEDSNVLLQKTFNTECTPLDRLKDVREEASALEDELDLVESSDDGPRRPGKLISNRTTMYGRKIM
jgi:hypothetical protein